MRLAFNLNGELVFKETSTFKLFKHYHRDHPTAARAVSAK